MGQGQEIIARKYMASATVEGQWVLLQNTHLGLGYLTEVRTNCPEPSFALDETTCSMGEPQVPCLLIH